MDFTTLKPLLDQAIASRLTLMDPRHEEAFRLFNGFYEGCPDLVLDVYGRTLVVHDYAEQPDTTLIREISKYIQASLNWLRAVIVKTRNGHTQDGKRGILTFGDAPDRKIKEHDIWHSIDLTLNRDASFYLDTPNLRKWLMDNMGGKTVLNTFAYTGSLGVAALAGGATRVVQTDHNRQFLNLAKDSYSLNGFPIHKQDFIAQDFFPVIARFKSAKQFFDCVILDPPFFSTTSKGKVDLVNESKRLINKVRPLINDGGILIAINNAVFLSGNDYMQTLEELCKDGYLSIRELIPIPQAFIGFGDLDKPITDPSPFNHSTKIAILDVKRKKQVTST
ncbi:MAG: class I SAM-dependent methyltransferase [Anaerolineales bacterium]|nr:class I SAM-dependent methyltransferase [Anaerolineales bacterium]WKZ41813.1 MAG: class I SAM-dependent methyltransferase [Anaerolineales bacterium]